MLVPSSFASYPHVDHSIPHRGKKRRVTFLKKQTIYEETPTCSVEKRIETGDVHYIVDEKGVFCP